MNSELGDYFRAQMVSPQWAFVLPALAEAMVGLANEGELHALFHSAGARMGEHAAEALSPLESVVELESVLNDFWFTRNWGQVALVEHKGYMEIIHQAAPLADAFGESSLAWTCGLLEGFYEALLRALGAGDGLGVVAESSDADGLILRFRFGR